MIDFCPKLVRVNGDEMFVRPLNETTLNSIMKHGESGFVILSANRSEIDSSNPKNSLRSEFETSGVGDAERWLKERNKKADLQLKKDIRGAGFSYSPIYGGYHGTDDVSDSYEPSFIVYSQKIGGKETDFDGLLDFALKMCGKYKQDSVYVQRPNQAPEYLDSEGNKVNDKSSNNFKFNRDNEEFFSTISRDKDNPQRFTADILFEGVYVNLRPASYNEKLRRIKSGEVIL